MNLRIKTRILLSCFLCLIVACTNENKQLKEATFWKYSDGFYIGDYVDFNSKSIKIQNDTIYKIETPIALIIKIKNRTILGDKLLYIKDIASSKEGIYVGK